MTTPRPVTRRTTPARPAATGPLMTTDEAADYLATTTETLRDWRRRGTGPAYVKMGRAIRYRRATVDDWIAARTVAPKKAS